MISPNGLCLKIWQPTPPSVHARTHTPVYVGVQQYVCVLGQLGEMDHLGLLLRPVTLIHPHIRKSGERDREKVRGKEERESEKRRRER